LYLADVTVLMPVVPLHVTASVPCNTVKPIIPRNIEIYLNAPKIEVKDYLASRISIMSSGMYFTDLSVCKKLCFVCCVVTG